MSTGGLAFSLMEASNPDLWLIALMKKEKLSFSDIAGAVDVIKAGGTKIGELFELELPSTVAGLPLRYKAKDRHGLFHEVLNDLDTLVREGLAARSMERATENELEEVFVITPEGIGRVGVLIVELQGGDFKVVG